MSEKNELTFEEKLEQVKQVADRIESGELSLEDSISAYEKGMKTLNSLSKELQNIQRRITKLQTDAAGESTEVELEVSES